MFTRGGKNVITTKTFLQFDLTIKSSLNRTELLANNDITTSEKVTIKLLCPPSFSNFYIWTTTARDVWTENVLKLKTNENARAEGP